MKKHIFLLIFSIVLLAGCQGMGKYEGLTAEEWFNEYDFSEADKQNLQNQVSDLEYERDDLQMQLEDMETEKVEIEDELQQAKDDYESLKSCIRREGEDAEDCYYQY